MASHIAYQNNVQNKQVQAIMREFSKKQDSIGQVVRGQANSQCFRQ
jgi:hypothetical protein